MFFSEFCVLKGAWTVMKKLVKFTAVFLCAAILLGPVSLVTVADENKPINEYPIVFVHGMFGWGDGEGINDIVPYWGATTGNTSDYLAEKGYECYCASVGPFSSSWDEVCELYAQIIGGVVDYGVAHSAEYDHARYGRTYTEPLVPNWGELDDEGKIQKIHLVGHSHGGNAIRLLTWLLTNGSEEEKSATPEGELSELFTGGKGQWVESCTTICSPLNGTTLYYAAEKIGIIPIAKVIAYVYAALAGRSQLNGKVVDFHLEQFGLTNIPGKNNAGEIFQAIIKCYKSNDSVVYGLSPAGIDDLNNKIDVCDDVYYFSYAFDATEVSPTTNRLYTANTDLSLLKLFSSILLLQGEVTDKERGVTYDKSWLPNDGLVNVVSALRPPDEPSTPFDTNNIQRGIWNVMDVRKGDHGTAIGLLADVDETHAFYDEIAERLLMLESKDI